MLLAQTDPESNQSRQISNCAKLAFYHLNIPHESLSR